MANGNALSMKPRFDCLLFDLDDTLYPRSTGMATACRKNIDEFLSNKLGLNMDVASSLRTRLYKTYGSSFSGLRAMGYEVEADEYHSFVHGRLPYEVIKPDPVLKSILLSLPQRKMIFTNSDRVHATEILKRLGLEDCFEDIICFESLNMDYPCNQQFHHNKLYTCTAIFKPSSEAMKRAITIANANPHRTIFFDDNARNISAAKAEGLHTVLVGSCVKSEGADYILEDIHNVRQIIGELWEETENYRGAHDKDGCSTGIVKTGEASGTPLVA